MKSGLRANPEIAGELQGRQALGRVRDKADSGQQIDIGELAGMQDRAGGFGELLPAVPCRRSAPRAVT